MSFKSKCHWEAIVKKQKSNSICLKKVKVEKQKAKWQKVEKQKSLNPSQACSMSASSPMGQSKIGFCQSSYSSGSASLPASPALDLLETKKKVQRNSLYHWVLWREALRGEKDRTNNPTPRARLSFNWHSRNYRYLFYNLHPVKCIFFYHIHTLLKKDWKIHNNSTSYFRSLCDKIFLEGFFFRTLFKNTKGKSG